MWPDRILSGSTGRSRTVSGSLVPDGVMRLTDRNCVLFGFSKSVRLAILQSVALAF